MTDCLKMQDVFVLLMFIDLTVEDEDGSAFYVRPDMLFPVHAVTVDLFSHSVDRAL